MARFLSIVDYGILATLFSIIYILSIFTESIQTVLTKYSASVSDKSKLKNLFKRSSRIALKVSVYAFVIYAVLSIFLSNEKFLNIPYSILILNGLFIFGAFFMPITRGLMQGRKMFKSLGFNMVLESAVKLVVAISLVLALTQTWKLYGAIASILIGAAVAYLFSLYSLKDILRSKEKNANTKEIYNYAGPVFFVTLIIVVFYSLDIILARMFLSEIQTGYYAIASVLSKAIFWGTLPISKAMFPLTAENNKKKKDKNVFSSSILILSVLIAIGIVAFYFLPDLAVRIFAGRYIPESAGILFYLVLATSLVSFANLNLLYKLSIGKTKGYLLLIIFIVIEVFLMWYFSGSLIQFSLAFLTSSAIFLWGSIVLLSR
tara:strand:+ start:6030 stop:7154 length:1125 start_codon:yes stop_codon:yes gene_type:complete